VHALLRAMKAALEPHAVAAPFLATWPIEGATLRPQQAQSLPVLSMLGRLDVQCTAATRPLVKMLVSRADSLSWRQTYNREEVGQAFLDNYGWTEIVGLRGPVPSDRLASGFLLLGPKTLYPAHVHAAEEIYLPLSGTADWLLRADWHTRAPGEPIHHPPRVAHATRTGATPMLALYAWRGEALSEKSTLLPAS